jgi:hypothetical protein
MWPQRYFVKRGEVVTFRSFVEFVETSPPRGLGVTVEILKNLCRDDKTATDLIDEVVRNPRGRPKKNRDNVTNLDGPTGNSGDKALRRLRDQRPTCMRE